MHYWGFFLFSNSSTEATLLDLSPEIIKHLNTSSENVFNVACKFDNMPVLCVHEKNIFK